MSDDLKDTDMMFPALRTMQSFFYVFTIMYFFFIYRPSDKWYVSIGYLFSVLNVLMVAAGLWGFIATGKSPCKGIGGYGAIVVINSIVGMIVGGAEVVLHGIFYMKFKATGKVPFLSPEDPKSN